MKRPALLLLFILASVSHAIVDTNDNGLSDLWEKQYNSGALFPETFDSQADDDGDGWTNAQEAAAGTSPFDPNPPDGFVRPETTYIPATEHIDSETGLTVIDTPEAIILCWPTIPGKQYTLFYSPDLSGGSWQPLEESYIGNGSVTEYGIPLIQQDGERPDKLFWRVSVQDVDTDGDGLTNHEEHLAGTDPAITDSDGDTLSDFAEISVGIDPNNQDSDGDGIPDPIDSQSLTSAFAFADADGDGIADGDDADPAAPRGPAPSFASQTASGNPVSNFIAGEALRFILSVSNYGGAMPEASNLTFFLNGTQETAEITTLGDTPPSTRRFLLTWTAKTTDVYPTRSLQNLTLRFRDSQQATSWFKLASIDVAEWEGMVAGSQAGPESDFWNAKIRSHSHGVYQNLSNLAFHNSGSSSWYRGPKTVPIHLSDGSAAGISFEITTGMRYPLVFITRDGGGPLGIKSVADCADPAAYPHDGTWYHNQHGKSIKVSRLPADLTVAPGASVYQPMPEQTETGPGYTYVQMFREDVTGAWKIFSSTNWPVYIAQGTMRRMSSVNFQTRADGGVEYSASDTYMPVQASIVPHAAGSIQYPGLSLPSGFHTGSTHSALLPIGQDVCHKIVLKVGPDAAAVSNGIGLWLRKGQAGGAVPQPGFTLMIRNTDGTVANLAVPTDGKITLAADSTNWQRLTSPEGLTLFMTRAAAVTDAHDLSLQLLKKHEWHEQDAIQCASINILPGEIVPDYNRDGKIDSADRGQITQEKPWRFWVNKDNDSGETEGSDISGDWYNGSGSWTENWQDDVVNGIRDLVDYFPLHLDLKASIVAYPETEHQYYLKHATGTRVSVDGFSAPMPSYGAVWCPDALLEADPVGPGGVGSYLRNIDRARLVADWTLNAVTSEGLRIPDAMLSAAKEGKGIVLLEGRQPATNPLVVEIRRNDGKVVGIMEFPSVISGVEQMFRWKYVIPEAGTLTQHDIPADPRNWPDADRNGKHFVFVHGYNVSGEQSKGWGAEMFKRMFWSGSNARFSAFAWWGNQSQIPHPLKPFTEKISPDYQVNLGHAFGTAKSFTQFLDLLDGEKTVAAHSMGNILVGSAMHDWGARPKNYIMLDSAAAKECYDASEAGDGPQNDLMENLAWRGYPKELRTSEWHNLPSPEVWPESDKRRTLTWRNRLRGVIDNGGQTAVYNFYSSGEEVLNNPRLTDPQSNDVIAEAWLKANRTWAVQEKRKGYGLTGWVQTSTYGGWLFNLLPYNSELHVPDTGNPWGTHRMRTPQELPVPLTNQWLLQRTMTPFFNPSNHPTLYDAQSGVGYPGSDYAQQHRNILIAEMIPCTSFAAGRNALQNLEDDDLILNVDMNALMKTDLNGWPESDELDLEENKPRPWLHSDIRNKAFTHNWKAYEKFVEIGQLKSTP